MTTPREFNQRITKRMVARWQKLRITTTELANRVGVSQAQISRLLNGKQGFRSSTLSRIANAMSVPPAYFVIESEILAEAMTDDTFRQIIAGQARKYLETQKLEDK